MKVSKNAHLLLKHTLTFTGEKEIGADGKEVAASLRLNGEESSQRRFYFKAIEDIDTPQKLFNEAKEKYEKKNPIGKELKPVYDMKFNKHFQDTKGLEKIEKIMNEEVEANITDLPFRFSKIY